MVVRPSYVTVALLIAAAQLSPIDPARVIVAGVDRIPGGLTADMPCLDQLSHVTRLDVSVAILCFFAFVRVAERIANYALPEAALGLASSSLLALAGLGCALLGCLRTFGWHPCQEIVGVGGLCAATAILFVLAGAFAKSRLMGAKERQKPRGDVYEVASPLRRRGAALRFSPARARARRD